MPDAPWRDVSLGGAPEDTAALGPEADAEAVARKILLDALTGRARSRSELATLLRRRKVPDGIASRLLDRFEEVGLIDDEAFAREWVEQRSTGRGLARRALEQELRRKGIDEAVARDVLDDLDPEEQREVARELVRRKLRSMSRLDAEAKTRRLVGMLARKGHPPGLAYAVVREEIERAGEDAPVALGTAMDDDVTDQ